MLRIASRRSSLAQAQAHQVGAALTEATGHSYEVTPMAATGDLHPERAVSAFDTKGVFVDTIRQAVLDGDCDLAVHSCKDLPAEAVAGLTIAAFPAREDPRDLLVSRDGHALATLPAGTTVGTSSERRRLQLLRARSSLEVAAIRGNLDTRLRKVADGAYDAVVVALAGLRRLYSPPEAGGIGAFDLPLTGAVLEPGECLPAPGQGAFAVEARADDATTLAACRRIDDADTRQTVMAERAFVARLGGGCLAPMGALCSVRGAELELTGVLADPSGSEVLRLSDRGSMHDPERLGTTVAETVIARGGEPMLAAIDQARAGQA